MPPKYLFKQHERIWTQLYKTIKSHHRIILFLDYDGTLVSIKKTPSLAILPYTIREQLQRLAEQHNLSLVLITGRSHSDIKNLVRIKNITIVSNHGYQISIGKKKWIHPEVKSFLPLLKKISQSLMESLKPFPETLVEDKEITLTVHFRNEEKRSVPLVKKIVSKVVQTYSKSFKTTTGKKIIEVRPNIEWNKGRAVLKVLTMLRFQKNKYTIVYIGDDKTDEDAFKMLRHKAITIRVGRSRNSQAEYYLRNPHEVQEFLDKIELMNSRRS